jgi:hypothetical protein
MGFSFSKNNDEKNIILINKIINDIIIAQNLLKNHESILLKKIRGSDEEAKNYISIGNKQKATKCLKYKKYIQNKLKILTNHKNDLENIVYSTEYNFFPQKNKYLTNNNIIPNINKIQNIIFNIDKSIKIINKDDYNESDNTKDNINNNNNYIFDNNINNNYIYDDDIDEELQLLAKLNTPDTNKIIINQAV